MHREVRTGLKARDDAQQHIEQRVIRLDDHQQERAHIALCATPDRLREQRQRLVGRARSVTRCGTSR